MKKYFQKFFPPIPIFLKENFLNFIHINIIRTTATALRSLINHLSGVPRATPVKRKRGEKILIPHQVIM